METHETQGDYLELMGILILTKTEMDSRDSGRLMDTHETQGDYWGHMNHRDCWVIKRLR